MKFDSENYNEDCSPKKCKICGCLEFNETTKDSLEGIVLEYKINCSKCGAFIGYWAHGHFEPCFACEDL